jgi:hypothetical protein
MQGGRAADTSAAARHSRGSSGDEFTAEADAGAGAGGSSGSDSGGGSSVALLSRELVKAQMGNADLQRKLRVSARCVCAAAFVRCFSAVQHKQLATWMSAVWLLADLMNSALAAMQHCKLLSQ